MNFQVENVGDVTVIVLPGKMLDTITADDFKTGVDSLIEDKQKVVFDMSDLQFVDSSGCGALISCLRKMKETDGRLILCCITDPVASLFSLIHIDLIFEVYPTREQAVESF